MDATSINTLNPLMPTVAIWAIKHSVPDRFKPSFVIFDIWALLRSALSVRVRVPGCQNYKWWLNPVWNRMLYSCTHIATVGVKHVKGLRTVWIHTGKKWAFKASASPAHHPTSTTTSKN